MSDEDSDEGAEARTPRAWIREFLRKRVPLRYTATQLIVFNPLVSSLTDEDWVTFVNEDERVYRVGIGIIRKPFRYGWKEDSADGSDEDGYLSDEQESGS